VRFEDDGEFAIRDEDGANVDGVGIGGGWFLRIVGTRITMR
jgi:hypothetical protein